MGKIFYRLGVIAGVLGFILFGIVLSLPSGKTVEVVSQIASLIVTLWLATIYLYQRDTLSWLGRAGFIALVIGGSISIFQNLMVFIVWKFDYATIEANLTTPLILVFLMASPLYVWAFMALGTTSLERGTLPRGSTILWFIGCLLFMVIPSYFTLAAAGTGVIWSGVAMWKRRGVIIENEIEVEGSIETKEGGHRPPNEGGSRLFSLDALRGLIMALMAIDHTSLLVRKAHSFEIFDRPVPLYESSGAFLTRFVTHICAPGFFFLMGVGMILLYDSRRERGWSYWQVARHFLIRGVALIVLEQLLLDPVLYRRIIWTEYGVLFALGGAMVLGILFLRLGTLPLLGIGTGLILLTQIAPAAAADLGIAQMPVVRMLFVPGQTGDWWIIYPILPWLGIAALGMAFGRELLKDRNAAYRKALIVGVLLLLIFVVVRIFGGFGNFYPPTGTSWIDFLNMVKYPPSLGFTLLTLGIDLLLIFLFAQLGDRLKKWGQPLLVFGGTALFFYFMHWFLLNQFAQFFPEGTSLPVMYACWIAIVALLYPICRSYLNFKRETRPESVWRLF